MPDDLAKTVVSAPISVHVVDDSAVIRGLYTKMLSSEPGIIVTGSASNGEQAIREVKRGIPDVVILDLEMPIMDGLTAIPQLLALASGLKILVASTLSTHNAEIAMKCLQAGAADYIPKPTATRDIVTGSGGGTDFKTEFVRKIRALAGQSRRSSELAAAPRKPVERPNIAPAVLHSAARKTAVEVLAIGSSTGGPQALFKLTRALGKNFPLPVLITQHMPPAFTSILASHIATQSGLQSAEGRDGEAVLPGHVYIAPGDRHMTVQTEAGRPTIRLNDGAPENFCRPAVDPMFRSVAKCYGARALTVILTGMGSDGAIGAKAIAAAGGTVIAQDEASSVVWGMPGAAAATGVCSAILPLDQIAPWIINRTRVPVS